MWKWTNDGAEAEWSLVCMRGMNYGQEKGRTTQETSRLPGQAFNSKNLEHSKPPGALR